ncbi:suppressor of fused domain protein [Oryzifoliimicrobium ureilyticus]|uniref:suppressor of fused domain protein n=1 Tax=Oryzifoliimicrobium ureilyticus TaxID=3113724 RepID=UPI00307679A0
MQKVSDENRLIAKTIVSVFGGVPNIRKYWDDNHISNLDIVACSDAPDEGVSSYATIGVSDYPIMRGKVEYPARVEILGVCDSNSPHYANIIATCGFCVVNDHWFLAPGVIFPNIVQMYSASKTMQHIAFVEPFIWEDKLSSLKLDTKTVDWLLAVPISEEEYRFAKDESFDALEDLFEKEQIDIFNIDRQSTR